MSKYAKTIIIIATLVAALFAVNAAFAQDDEPPAPVYPYGPHMGGGFYGGGGWMHSYNYDTSMHEVIAEALDMTVTEFEAEMFENGKTMWQLAEERGVEFSVIWEAKQAARAEAIEQAVADGVLDQAQADWMLERMTGGFGGGCWMSGGWNADSATAFTRRGGMGRGWRG